MIKSCSLIPLGIWVPSSKPLLTLIPLNTKLHQSMLFVWCSFDPANSKKDVSCHCIKRRGELDELRYTYTRKTWKFCSSVKKSWCWLGMQYSVLSQRHVHASPSWMQCKKHSSKEDWTGNGLLHCPSRFQFFLSHPAVPRRRCRQSNCSVVKPSRAIRKPRARRLQTAQYFCS